MWRPAVTRMYKNAGKKEIKRLHIWASITVQSHHQSKRSSVHVPRFHPSSHRLLGRVCCPVRGLMVEPGNTPHVPKQLFWWQNDARLFKTCILLKRASSFQSSVYIPEYCTRLSILSILPVEAHPIFRLLNLWKLLKTLKSTFWIEAVSIPVISFEQSDKDYNPHSPCKTRSESA